MPKSKIFEMPELSGRQEEEVPLGEREEEVVETVVSSKPMLETSLDAFNKPKNKNPGPKASDLIKQMEECIGRKDGELLSSLVYDVEDEIEDDPALGKQIDIDWYVQKAQELLNQAEEE